jgi:membrane protein DedA with SNARE-associated domain
VGRRGSSTLGCHTVDAALSVVNAVAGLPPGLLYLVIVLWLVAESAGAPIPNEAILLFSGFLVGSGQLDLFLAWAVSIVGTLGGASLSWWIACTFGPAGVRRVGRYVLLTEGRMATAQGFFHRRGAVTIFLARLTPIVRTVISYPAGLARMPYRPFALATVAGCALWNMMILLLGRAAGEHWRDLFERFHTPFLLVAVAVVLAAAAYLALEHAVKKRYAGVEGDV